MQQEIMLPQGGANHGGGGHIALAGNDESMIQQRRLKSQKVMHTLDYSPHVSSSQSGHEGLSSSVQYYGVPSPHASGCPPQAHPSHHLPMIHPDQGGQPQQQQHLIASQVAPQTQQASSSQPQMERGPVYRVYTESSTTTAKHVTPPSVVPPPMTSALPLTATKQQLLTSPTNQPVSSSNEGPLATSSSGSNLPQPNPQLRSYLNTIGITQPNGGTGTPSPVGAQPLTPSKRRHPDSQPPVTDRMVPPQNAHTHSHNYSPSPEDKGSAPLAGHHPGTASAYGVPRSGLQQSQPTPPPQMAPPPTASAVHSTTQPSISPPPPNTAASQPSVQQQQQQLELQAQSQQQAATPHASSSQPRPTKQPVRGRVNVYASNKLVKTCPMCRDSSVVVLDNSSGDELCSGCGLVLESRVLSEEQEWRNFSDTGGGETRNKSRVGGPNDTWLTSGVQGTSMLGGATNEGKELMRTQERASSVGNADRQLMTAFAHLRTVAESFSLRDNVVERCKEIVKEMQLGGHLKNRTGPLYMLSVCYLACREAGISRTLKELVVFDESITEKELGKAINRLRKMLPSRSVRVSYTSAELMPRFCCRLHLSQQVVNVAEYVCGRAEMVLNRSHKPNSLVAGAIFLVTRLCNVRVEPSEIAAAAGTGESTVHTVYKEMKALVSQLLPPDFTPTLPGGLEALPH